MSEHFRNSRSLPIEGYSDQFFHNLKKNKVKKNLNTLSFIISDGLKLNAAKTYAHMLFLYQCLMEKQNLLIEGGIILNNTDVCVKKYQFAAAFDLLCIFLVPTKRFALIRLLDHLTMVNI